MKRLFFAGLNKLRIRKNKLNPSGNINKGSSLLKKYVFKKTIINSLEEI
tara:strand:- start:78 stop:224 length:147 start_codon:yes stop_codon:yes gene_type:complete